MAALFRNSYNLLWALTVILVRVSCGSYFGEHFDEDREWEQRLALRTSYASMSMPGTVPRPGDEVLLEVGIECDNPGFLVDENSRITENNFIETMGDASCNELWNTVTSNDPPLSTVATLLFLVCVRVSLQAIGLQVCETGKLGSDEPRLTATRELQGTPLARLGA
jgi:hypothetical protein